MPDPGAAQQQQLSEKIETALKVCKRALKQTVKQELSTGGSMIRADGRLMFELLASSKHRALLLQDDDMVGLIDQSIKLFDGILQQESEVVEKIVAEAHALQANMASVLSVLNETVAEAIQLAPTALQEKQGDLGASSSSSTWRVELLETELAASVEEAKSLREQVQKLESQLVAVETVSSKTCTQLEEVWRTSSAQVKNLELELKGGSTSSEVSSKFAGGDHALPEVREAVGDSDAESRHLIADLEKKLARSMERNVDIDALEKRVAEYDAFIKASGGGGGAGAGAGGGGGGGGGGVGGGRSDGGGGGDESSRADLQDVSSLGKRLSDVEALLESARGDAEREAESKARIEKEAGVLIARVATLEKELEATRASNPQSPGDTQIMPRLDEEDERGPSRQEAASLRVSVNAGAAGNDASLRASPPVSEASPITVGTMSTMTPPTTGARGWSKRSGLLIGGGAGASMSMSPMERSVQVNEEVERVRDGFASELERMERDIAAHDTRLDAYRRDLVSARRECDDLRGKLKATRGELDRERRDGAEAVLQVARGREMIEELSRTQRETAAQADSLRGGQERAERAEATMEEVKKREGVMRKEVAAVKASRVEALREARAAREEALAAQREQARLSEAVVAAEEARDRARSGMEEGARRMASVHEELRVRALESEGEAASLREALVQAGMDSQRLGFEVERAKADATEAMERVAELEGVNASQSRRMQELIDEAQQLRNDREVVRGHNDMLERDLAKLIKYDREYQEKNGALERRLNVAKDMFDVFSDRAHKAEEGLSKIPPMAEQVRSLAKACVEETWAVRRLVEVAEEERRAAVVRCEEAERSAMDAASKCGSLTVEVGLKKEEIARLKLEVVRVKSELKHVCYELDDARDGMQGGMLGGGGRWERWLGEGGNDEEASVVEHGRRLSPTSKVGQREWSVVADLHDLTRSMGDDGIQSALHRHGGLAQEGRAVDESAVLKGELDNAKMELGQSVEVRKLLEQQLADARASNERQIRVMDSRIADLEEERVRLRQSVEELGGSLGNLQFELVSDRAKLDESREAEGRLQGEVDECLSVVEVLKEELEDAGGRLDEAYEAIEVAQQRASLERSRGTRLEVECVEGIAVGVGGEGVGGRGGGLNGGGTRERDADEEGNRLDSEKAQEDADVQEDAEVWHLLDVERAKCGELADKVKRLKGELKASRRELQTAWERVEELDGELDVVHAELRAERERGCVLEESLVEAVGEGVVTGDVEMLMKGLQGGTAGGVGDYSLLSPTFGGRQTPGAGASTGTGRSGARGRMDVPDVDCQLGESHSNAWPRRRLPTTSAQDKATTPASGRVTPAADGDTSVAHGEIGMMTESMRMTEAGLLEELEGERVRLMGRVDALEAKVAGLSGQLSAATGERDAIVAKLEEAYGIIHELERAVAERDSMVRGLEEAGQGRQGFEIEGGEESRGVLLDREGDLEEAKACLDAAARELEEAQGRVEALQAELYAAVEERDHLLSERHDVSLEKARLGELAERLEEANKAMSFSSETERKAELARYQTEAVLHKAEIAGANGRIEVLEGEAARSKGRARDLEGRLSKADAERGALEGRIKGMMRRCEEAEGGMMAASERCQELEHKMMEMNGLWEIAGAMEVALGRLEGAFRGVKGGVRDLEGKLGVVEGGIEGERGARERAEAELEGVSGRVWDLEREKGELSGEVVRLKGELERRSKELEKVRTEGIRRMSAAEEEARTAREAADKHEKVSERIMSSLSSLKGHLDAVGLAPARRLLLDSQGEGAKEEGEDGFYDAEAVVAGARSCLRELKERRDECLTLGDEVKAMKTQVEELGRLAEERGVDAQSTMRKNEKLSGEVETHAKRAESLSKMGQRAKGASQELGMLVNRLRSLRQDAEGGG